MDFCANTEKAAGVSSTEIYACLVSDIDTFAELPNKDAVTTLEAAATITDSHVFKEGKGFFKIAILPETGMVESPAEGESASKTYVNSFSGTLPDISAKYKGFLRKYTNLPMIFIITQINGQKVQLGTKVSPAYLKEAAPSSGAKAGDVVGIPVKFSDSQSYPAPDYNGTVTEFTPAE